MGKYQYLDSDKGFTTIELIVVIILLGIMSASIIPKMFSTQGFSERTYINEVLNKLRAIQLRSMQQTDTNNCHSITITDKLLTNDVGNAQGCDIWSSGSTQVVIDDANVEFDLTQATSFNFNSLGQVENCNVSPCRVRIVTDTGNSLSVTIESEGYIHVNQ